MAPIPKALHIPQAPKQWPKQPQFNKTYCFEVALTARPNAEQENKAMTITTPGWRCFVQDRNLTPKDQEAQVGPHVV